MTINLAKHKEDLLKAYNDVLRSEIDGEWATFSYEGTSNTLKPDSAGHGGIDEMRENLDTGKLMYALIKLKDPSTNLWKLMLIHWQGEGVQALKLAPFASHIHEVKKFFKGVHLTHYARCEDDVDSDSILGSFKKVNYGASDIESRDVSKEPITTPSVYKKVDLKRDINAEQRDEFWAETEKEEARRQEENRRKIIVERRRVEDEQQRLQREISNKSIEAEPRQNTVSSEMMRRERLQEIKDVISPKSALKSMWEEKTALKDESPLVVRNKPLAKTAVAAPSVVPAAPSVVPAALPVVPAAPSVDRHDFFASENAVQAEAPLDFGTLPTHEPTESIDVGHVTNGVRALDTSHNDSAIAPQANINTQILDSHQDGDLDDKEWETDILDNKNDQEVYEDVINAVPCVVDEPEPMKPRPTSGLGLQAEALWDYQAADDTEISFNPGDVICHIDCIDEGWWRGQGPDGSVGLFPANYVELLQH